jgi:Mn-containing catalase
VSAPALADLIREFYLERVALLMRHEDVAVTITDYDINNAYQYIIAREETHLSWLLHALMDLGAPMPQDPARGTSLSAKAEEWKRFADEDAKANAQFVERWRPRIETITHARHKGMLNVILGEMLEHKRLFDQAAAGRRDLIGTSLDINDHSGKVMSARFVGHID